MEEEDDEEEDYKKDTRAGKAHDGVITERKWEENEARSKDGHFSRSKQPNYRIRENVHRVGETESW